MQWKCSFHYKCAKVSKNDCIIENWVCWVSCVCEGRNLLNVSFSKDNNIGVLSVLESQFIIRENNLLKKLLKEMEKKNIILQENIKFK